tara:strand:- start:3706 stop:6633 length:2928 start_codon:yes stop_codon:yes gene_type:complete
MALIKQFGLGGVNENVQFGKGNGRLKFDTTSNTFSIRNLADSDLVNIHVKDPIINSHAATKEYVDSISQGLKPKASVRVATNPLTSIDSNVSSGSITDDMTNLTYNSGNDTWTLVGGIIDNVTLATNDRVLVKDATGNDAVGNGIFTFNGAGTLTRALDADNLNPAGQNVGVSFADIIKSGSTSSWEIGAATLTWPTTASTSYGPDTTHDAGYQAGHAVVAKEIDGESHVMIGQGGPNSGDPDPTYHLYKYDGNGARVKIGSIQTSSAVYGRDSDPNPSQHSDFCKNSGNEYKIVVGSLNNGFQVWDVATNTMDYEVTTEMGNNADDVACDGDYVVANNSYDSTIPGGTVNAVSGYARVFNLADGSHLYDITPPTYDGFGSNTGVGYRAGVKLHGNWLVIGSNEWGQNSAGRVDIWNVTTGAHVRTIQTSAGDYSVPPGADADDFNSVGDFGQQFDIDGDNLVVTMVGEPATSATGSGGMVEVYDINTGNRLARLQNPNGDSGNAVVGYHHSMGRYAVDISGDYVAVDGGDWEQGGTSGSGNSVVYLFNWRTGAVQEIYQTSGNEYDQFGQDIALSGGRLFIGAAYDDNGGSNASNPGRVYQYNSTSQAGSPETLVVNGTTMDIQGTPQQCADTINNNFSIPRLVASVNGNGQLTLTYSPNASDDNFIINAAAATTTGLPSGTFAPVTNTTGTDVAYSSEFGGGTFTFVLEGRSWADSGWVVSSPTGLADIGTDDITWVQFSRVTGIHADDGLAKDGNRVFVRTDGTTTHIDNDDVAVKSSNTQYQSLISNGAGGTANWEAISLNESGATQNLLRRDRGGLGSDVSFYADQSLYVSNSYGTEEFQIGQPGQLLTVDTNGDLSWGYGLSGVSNTRQVAISATTGTVSIGTAIPANSRVTSVTVKIDTAYDAGVGMIVGDGSNADSLATADEIDPQVTGLYKIDLIQHYSASTQLSISISGTTANGSGYVIVDYVAS